MVGLFALAGIVAAAPGNEIHDSEGEAAQAASAMWQEGRQVLANLQPHDPSEVIDAALETSSRLMYEIEKQMSRLMNGDSIEQEVTNDIIAAMNGQPNSIVEGGLVTIVRLALVEWDISPEGAAAWVRAATST